MADKATLRQYAQPTQAYLHTVVRTTHNAVLGKLTWLLKPPILQRSSLKWANKKTENCSCPVEAHQTRTNGSNSTHYCARADKTKNFLQLMWDWIVIGTCSALQSLIVVQRTITLHQQSCVSTSCKNGAMKHRRYMCV